MTSGRNGHLLQVVRTGADARPEPQLEVSNSCDQVRIVEEACPCPGATEIGRNRIVRWVFQGLDRDLLDQHLCCTPQQLGVFEPRRDGAVRHVAARAFQSEATMVIDQPFSARRLELSDTYFAMRRRVSGRRRAPARAWSISAWVRPRSVVIASAAGKGTIVVSTAGTQRRCREA